MADNSIIQTIQDAEIDARSLSEFISKGAEFMVTRRLAPTIHTLDYYLLALDEVKDKGDLADIAISDTLDKLDQLEPTVMQRVEDAINNTAVEGGVLADTFVTVTSRNGSTPRTLRDRNAETVSVKDFGAVGDGVVDDTAAIQAAVDSITSGKVFIPKGRYKLTGPIRLKSNVSFIGEGAGATILETSDNPSTDYQYSILVPQSSGVRSENIHIKGMSLVSTTGIPEAAKFYNCIRINNADGVIVEQIENIESHGTVILGNVTNFVIRDIVSKNNRDGAIAFFTGTKQGIVENLSCLSVGEAVDFFDNEDIVIRGVYAVANPDGGGEAIDLSSSRNITIKDSTFKGFKTGVLVKTEEKIPTKNYTIENCVFEDYSLFGVSVNHSAITAFDGVVYTREIKVTNCLFKTDTTTADAVSLVSSFGLSDAVVTNNIFNGGRVAVNIWGVVTDTVVSNNIIDGVSTGVWLHSVPNGGPKMCVVSSNKITSTGLANTSNPIRLDKSNEITVDSNILLAELDAVYVRQCADLTISNNRIDSKRLGMQIQVDDETALTNSDGVLNISVLNNAIKNVGVDSNFRAGIKIIFVEDSSIGFYSGLVVTGNIVSTPKSNPNTVYGFQIIFGSLQMLVGSVIANNVFVGMSAPVNLPTANLGSTAILKDNAIVPKTMSSDKPAPSTTGTTANRPTPESSALEVGFQYFDSTLNKPVFWSGSIWVDIEGTVVEESP